MFHNLLKSALIFGLVATTSPAALAQHDHGSHGDHGSHNHDTAKTQVKVVDGIQVALDFQTMAQHHEMMKMMALKMDHKKGMTHHISVTLMQAKAKSLIKEATVKIKLIGPDKKTLGPESGTAMIPMSGKGMHHYGADYALSKKGTYHAILLFKVGEKKHSTTFQIKYE